MSKHYETDSLPPTFQDLVDRELEPDENLYWVGRPVPTLLLLGPAFLFVLFAIPWTASAVFWMWSAASTGAPLFFTLFGTPFVLIGLVMFGSPFFMWRGVKNTVYAITDQRAMILTRSFFSTNAVSVWPDDLGKLQRKERAGGFGDVLFGESSFADHQTLGKLPANGFFNVPDMREVERLFKNLAAQVTKEEAQEPQAVEQRHDLPILHLLDSTPRDLPVSVRLYLRLCSTVMPFFGWFFAGFGLMFALVAIAVSKPEEIAGALIFVAVGSLFGIVGLCFPVYSWISGDKAVRLLREGFAIRARHLTTDSTGMTVNDKPVMKVVFEYQVEGESYTVSAQALDVSRLTDAKDKVVLYDPTLPGRAVVLDGLPRGIHLDELTGRFRVNPLRCVLPLMAATIVCGEIIAIVVLLLLLAI